MSETTDKMDEATYSCMTIAVKLGDLSQDAKKNKLDMETLPGELWELREQIMKIGRDYVRTKKHLEYTQNEYNNLIKKLEQRLGIQRKV